MTRLLRGARARRAIALAAFGLALVAALGTVQPSHATFRGANGLLVFQAPVGANTQLFTIKPDGTALTQITRFTDSGADSAAWSKDGLHIVFTRHWDPAGPNEKITVYTMKADGSGVRALRKTGKGAVGPTWLPNGRRIVYLDVITGKLMVIDAKGGSVRAAGVSGVGGDSACALRDGKRVAFLRPKAGDDAVRAIFVAGLFGHGIKRITPWGGYADKIDCSPDGKRIVFSKPAFSSESSVSSNVFTVNGDGSGELQLTHESDGKSNAGADSWSPDGTKIAYVSNRSGTYQIWTMNADGTGQTQLTTGTEAHLAAWGSHR
jgi:Tol biopolymer transport system component